MKLFLYVTVLLSLILSACGPNGSGNASPEPVVPSPDDDPSVETPAPAVEYPAAALAARDALAGQSGVPAVQIEIETVEMVEWPDSCLGVSVFGEICADVITPGYRVILKHGETAYEFHTNLDGASIRQVEQRQMGGYPPEAQSALLQFSQALNRGDYITGAKLYGGDTQILQDWNPDIQNDLPAWLERACTQNGLVCLLPRSLTYTGLDEDGNLQFLVEYNNPDGSLFRQGPCCGEETGPVFTSFLVRAKKQDDLWLVLDLPPYVP
jgi:hypothetical protein